ncbi:retrovirus-related pol polyprotein from transposon TNT 1-94 [Tanacetum coccineum]
MVKFGNDQIAPILDLEVAFRKSTCYIRDLKGNDLLTCSCGTDLYSITLQDSTTPNPICLMAKATSSQAWLWHRHLSHLNFDTINLILKNNIVNGLPKLIFFKDHLCSSCELGKAKRKSFHTKTTPSSKRQLQLLHMDLYGPMQVESINGKKYVLVIVDDYSRYTWTHFFRSKDETPGVLIGFLTLVQRGLHAQVTTVQTDKDTEFLNKTLHAYFSKEGIRHETSTSRTPKQNGVVKRQNRTLVEVARTMLSAAKVHLFFWAEAIATTCFTQNRSLVIPRHEKTPYHIINARKPSVKFFHIFGSLCYIVRDGENLDKMKEKGDACIFVGYSTQSKAYRVFNKRTRIIVETIHVNFDQLPQMASDHVKKVPQVAEKVTTSNELELLYSPIFSEILNGTSPVVSKSSAVHAADNPDQRQQHNTTHTSTTTYVTDPPPLNIQSTHQTPTQVPTVTAPENIIQAETNTKNAQFDDDEFINIFSTPVQEQGETSSCHVDSSNSNFLSTPLLPQRWTKESSIRTSHGKSFSIIRMKISSLENRMARCLRDMLKRNELISKTHLHQLLGWRPSDGFVDPYHPDKVYRPKKALYGLKQAPRARDGENLDKKQEKGNICSTTVLEQDSLSPDPQCQENVPQVAETVTTSNELELLYSLMFSELLNGTSPVVSKSSTVHAADNPDKHQQHNTTHTSTTTDVADPPPLNIQSTHQTPTQVPTVTAPENIIQAETNTENAQFDEDEFINIFSTPVQEQGETSSRHVDSSNMHTFYQHHPSAQHWTKDHPLEQVIGNPSQSIRTRRQLETDGEMSKGYAQKEGIDFEESFAPVARLDAVRLFIAYTAHKSFTVYQMDVKTTFLYSHSKGRRINQPDGLLTHSHPEQSLPSQEALYGLKQAQDVLQKHLDADLSGTPVDQTKYRSMVGALMYLTASRPYIVHATCYCARYQAKPTEKHLTAVRADLWYLKSPLKGLWYPKDTGFELTAFSDSDHAGCLDSRKSTFWWAYNY